MKQIFNFLVLSFFVSFSVLAARNPGTEPVKLTWSKQAAIGKSGNQKNTIPFPAEGHLSVIEQLPVYTVRVTDKQLATFALKNPVYAAFTTEEAKNLPKDKLSASPKFSIQNSVSNGRHISAVTFVPVRLNPQTGMAEKLISFEYTFTENALRPGKPKSSRLFSQTSVLNSGNWYKIGITGSGIYKIDFTALKAIGINPADINPQMLKVYGNGGGMLPQSNQADRADDLVQNRIVVSGEADGQFNANDYVLFYGQGPHTWKADSLSKRFVHAHNLYSDTAYYYLTVGNTPGDRVTTRNVQGTPSQTISTFAEHLYHEEEKVNLLISGREWYGEEFNSFSLSKDFFFPISDLAPNTPVSVTSSVVSTSPVSRNSIGGIFTIRLENTVIGSQNINGTGGGDYGPAGTEDRDTFTANSSSFSFNNTTLKVNLAFNQMGLASNRGFLNYLELNAIRQLKLYGSQTSFRSFENRGPNTVSAFKIGNVIPGQTFVWDVTNPSQPALHNLNFINGNEATFPALTNTVREFVVFSGTNFNAPVPFGKVANQNLHSLNVNGKLDMVIVTHPAFINQANKLANHRNQHDKLNVAVVTTNQVYNEFSSGSQDVTAIRDLMKMVYDRKVLKGTKTADSLIYLLLLGDGSYDYKSKFSNASLNRTANNNNFVPVYQSYNSLHPLLTYSSEDYFGNLDDTEGEWDEIFSADRLDIGIGRIPANTIENADVMVNKIIDYDNPSHYGKWRNRVSFIADDEDSMTHQDEADKVAGVVQKNHPEYNVSKVYLDMFKQLPVPNGQRSPACVAEIDRVIEQGSLVTNYVGHGGETGWGHEQILTVNQVNSWENYDRPTFMLTATCEYGRYDDPRRPSAAELSLHNGKGGTVGMFTTTRPVLQYSNDELNNSFYDCVFEPIHGRMPRLGELYRITKNNSVIGPNNRNFALLGDPSMRLAYPEEDVNVTSVTINGGTQPTDTIKALSTVTIAGNVLNKQQAILTGFNGKVQVTIFEKPTTIRTLGDAGQAQKNIEVRESIIYDGIVTAENGAYTTTFVVPKDINYNYGFGKVSLYAFANNVDANGVKTNLIVGGSDDNAPLDTIPPVVKLFMDSESFVYGGLTGNDAMLISHLSDDNGINTAGLGIGHEITATLDGNKENVKVLNDYYTADLDNYRSGKVRYMFKTLTPGPHELRVKAWDTHNNSSEKRIEFMVANSAGLALEHILNYPNPFSSITTFHFDHNRAGEDLDIQIQIFTVSGKLIKTLRTTSYSSPSHIGRVQDSELTWNGKDEFGDVLGKGVYVYKLNVRSRNDNTKVSKYEKLVLLN